jgi:alcohol dehydrogenase (cytochrome c)
VFSGSLDRVFQAFDDETGKVLWQTRLNNVISAFPITYTVNGKQYVAIAAGGGSSMSRSLATLTTEIQNPDGGSVLWVFALPN